MNDAWRLVLDEDAFQFLLAQRGGQRQSLFKTLDSLRVDPHQETNFEVVDSVGRALSVRQARPFLVTYWLDGSVKEIRVLNIELVATS